MTDTSDSLGWVKSVNMEVATEALAILEAAIHELDLASDQILIGAYPHDTPPSLPVGQDDALMERRSKVAQMLVRRGVLTSQRTIFRGGPYTSEGQLGHWLVLEGDEGAIRSTAEALRARVRPPRITPDRERRDRLPQNQRDALPGPLTPASPTHVYNAAVSVTNVNTTGDNAKVNVTGNAREVAELVSFADKVERELGQLELPEPERVSLRGEIEKLKKEAKAASPRGRILRGAVEAIVKGLAGGTAQAAATPLIQMGKDLLGACFLNSRRMHSAEQAR